MCGRSCLTLSKDQIQCACSYKFNKNTFNKPEWLEEYNAGKEYIPSYNIAPTEVTPVLVSASKFKSISETERVLKPMIWGLIPPWHRGDFKSHNLSTNNCRLENISTSKLYNPIIKSGGRCIVVVEGFYEWQTTNKSAKIKQPYYLHSPQNKGIQIDDPQTWNNKFDKEAGWAGINLLYMAGLYSTWQDDNTIIYSYTIITMDSSNSTINWLHHRIPAILNTQEEIQAWLDIDEVNSDQALSYLKQSKTLSWYPVSTLVNNSKNKSTDCNKRISLPSKSTQTTLNTFFMKRQTSINSDSKEIKKMKHSLL